MKCIVCHENETEGLNEYCVRCFLTAISELDKRYGKKEGPFSAREDVEVAPASEPLTENTHR